MTWVILLSLHLVGLVGYTILLRKSALSKINKYALAALMQTAVFLPSVYFFVKGEVLFSLSTAQYATLFLAGCLVVGLHLTAIKALQQLEASTFSIIYNTRLLFTTLLGFIFFNESPPLLQLFGGVIIFCSILMLHLHRNKQFFTAPILYGLLAAIWLSVYATLEKHIVTTIGFETYIFTGGLLGAVFLWLLAFFKGASLRELRTHIDRPFLALLLLRPLSAWTIVLSFTYGSLAVANYVSGMSVPLIVLCGALFLGERDRLQQKILAVVVSVVGLTLILISKL